jgi:cytochrome c oxidase subunit 1
MLGMPRRVAIYAPEFQVLNQIVSIAAFALGISTFIFVVNALWSMFNGPRAGANPWRALTLEWATTSPPPPHNFIGDPVPFKNPYGYGTRAAHAYLDAIDKQFGAPEEPPATRELEPKTAPGAGD